MQQRCVGREPMRERVGRDMQLDGMSMRVCHGVCVCMVRQHKSACAPLQHTQQRRARRTRRRKAEAPHCNYLSGRWAGMAPTISRPPARSDSSGEPGRGRSADRAASGKCCVRQGGGWQQHTSGRGPKAGGTSRMGVEQGSSVAGPGRPHSCGIVHPRRRRHNQKRLR
jgi:hypothetical protein